MKKTLFILSLLAATLSSVSAATLIADITTNGLTLADGTTPLANGRIRFGTFVVSNSLISANANDLAYLNTNFREVVNYTGAIGFTFESVVYPGIFDATGLGSATTYAGGSTSYGGTTFDGSTGNTNNVAGDIAGGSIYMWVLNNAVVSNATQHGIFVNNANVWTDSDTTPITDSFFDLDPLNTTALVGTLSVGADLGGGNPSHSLATVAAIPEPSRAILGLAGLGALFFRRRRNA